MENIRVNQADVAATESVKNVQNGVVETDVQNEVDIFAELMQSDVVAVDKSREDIIREIVASGNGKLLKSLTVRNVIATQYDTHALLTFVIREFVIGDTRDTNKTDAFGMPVVKLGRTHNVQTSTFAVAGVMKDSPKLAIFATDVVDTPQMANMLFAGAKIDVLLQHVPAGQEYTNPFASNAAPVVFERDKMIHHVIALSMGEVGEDMYRARILK